MGMECIMLDKKGPHFPDPLRSPTEKQYKDIMARDVDIKKELQYVYDAITVTRRKLEGRVPLIGFCGAPWTLFCYMVEGGGSKLFKEVKTWIFKHQDDTKAILQKIAELCVEYLALQVVAGAQVGLFTARMDSANGLSWYKCSTHGLASYPLPHSRSSHCHT